MRALALEMKYAGIAFGATDGAVDEERDLRRI